jgi:hypothetical protein
MLEKRRERGDLIESYKLLTGREKYRATSSFNALVRIVSYEDTQGNFFSKDPDSMLELLVFSELLVIGTNCQQSTRSKLDMTVSTNAIWLFKAA